VKSKKIT